MFETAVQYDLRPDVMTYVKYSTSSKSGGFSASDVAAADNLEFGDERARGFEAGLKARLLSNRMTLALTAFRTSFSDLQLKSDIVTDLGQSITIVSNAGRSRSQGFEIDMRYSPDNRLLFQLAAGYLDGKFTDFTTAPCGTSNVAPTGATACDFSGRVMPFAAHWTGSASFQWVPQITERAKAIIAPSVEFSSKYYTDGTLDQAGLQNNWAKIDARLGLAGLDGRWELSLIGKNLTNRRVLSGFQPAILYPIAFYGVPRTMSLRLAYHM
jgi:outer membrane receptor protein involved in Fe transport